MISFNKLVLFSPLFDTDKEAMIQGAREQDSGSNTEYLINILKYFEASYEAKPTWTIFFQCAQKIFYAI